MEDKLPIATNHLLPRQREQHGLGEDQVQVGGWHLLPGTWHLTPGR